MTNKKYLQSDIVDSPEDQEKLKPDTANLDLPELKDIPSATRLQKPDSEFTGDTTISSSDEEGNELFEDDADSGASNVSSTEKKMLQESFDSPYDADLPVEEISLDDRDNEGELLEESGPKQDLFGKDLDSNLINEEDEETEGENQQ